MILTIQYIKETYILYRLKVTVDLDPLQAKQELSHGSIVLDSWAASHLRHFLQWFDEAFAINILITRFDSYCSPSDSG